MNTYLQVGFGAGVLLVIVYLTGSHTRGRGGHRDALADMFSLFVTGIGLGTAIRLWVICLSTSDADFEPLESADRAYVFFGGIALAYTAARTSSRLVKSAWTRPTARDPENDNPLYIS